MVVSYVQITKWKDEYIMIKLELWSGSQRLQKYVIDEVVI